MKFKRNDEIVHVNSGRRYVVTATPDPHRLLEALGSPYYEYRGQDGISWIRERDEMQDGRFKKLTPTLSSRTR